MSPRSNSCGFQLSLLKAYEQILGHASVKALGHQLTLGRISWNIRFDSLGGVSG